jgi:imidazolonepropionase-like amidohydrolase
VVVDGTPYVYSTDDLRFIVTEARMAGRKVAAHVQTSRGARNAIEAGVASIEHGWRLSDDDFALMKKNGVALVGTDFTEEVLQGFGWDKNQAQRTHAARVERLRRAHRAGVTIAFGSDVMVDVPGRTRGQLAVSYVDSFIEGGIQPWDTLAMMTINAATLLGVEKERGTIGVGMAADLIATKTNPLTSLDALKSLTFVMKNGRVHRHEH